MNIDENFEPGIYRANFEVRNHMPEDHEFWTPPEFEIEKGEIFYITGETMGGEIDMIVLYPILASGMVKYGVPDKSISPYRLRERKEPRFIKLTSEEEHQVAERCRSKPPHPKTREYLRDLL